MSKPARLLAVFGAALIACVAGAQHANAQTGTQAIDTLWHYTPRGVIFGFDHVLSIYEWQSLFDYSSQAAAPWQKPLDWFGPVTDVHLRANSRFLPQDSLTTTEASGWMTAMQPLKA